MNFIQQNIKHLRLKSGLNQGDFAALFRVSRDNIASYERGSEPKIDFIQKIVNYFHISFDEFISFDLSEKPEPVPYPEEEGISESIIVKERQDFLLRTDRKRDLQTIPLFDLQASAGIIPSFLAKENIIDYITIPNLPPCDGALPVRGDSMYPLLRSGDIVCYQLIHDIKEDVLWGEMYLISLKDSRMDDFVVVKYVQKSDKGEEYIKLVSQNQHHAAKDVKFNKVKAMALVKATIRINTMY